jgi:hypothetical protein
MNLSLPANAMDRACQGSISRSSLLTSSAIGGCKRLERELAFKKAENRRPPLSPRSNLAFRMNENISALRSRFT